MENNPQSPLSWDIDLARRMRGAGMSFTYIGAAFGVTAGTVHCRIDPEYRTRRRRQVYERRGPQTSIAAFINVASRVANVELEARLAEIPEDDRDFTARAFGDPVFARSAAAQRPTSRGVARPGITLQPVSILSSPKQEGQPR